MSLFGGSKEKTSKISVVAQAKAKSNHEDKVRTLFEGLVAASLKEPGCLKYSVFEDAHYPGSFFTYEEWEDEAALDAHLQVNREGLNQAKALLQQDLRISVLKLLA